MNYNYTNQQGKDFSKLDLSAITCIETDFTQADFSNATLRNCYCSKSKFDNANFFFTNLQNCTIICSSAREIDARYSNFSLANLANTDFTGTNFRGANFFGANLIQANLSGTNLTGTHLLGSCLKDADLSDALLPTFQIIQEYDIVVWKKKRGVLVKLLIPDGVERTACLISNKCRAAAAKVLSVENDKHEVDIYKEGEMVYPDSYNPDIRIDCTHGIHFFRTRKEAEEW